MNRDAFGTAHALVAWSEWAAASLVSEYAIPRERIVVTAPGASEQYFAIGERRVARRDPQRPARLLFVGGDFVRKGGFLLLEAVRAARTRRAFELHIVTRDDVPATAGVVVHRGIGPNSPELLALFADSDVFVLPSLGECLSVALMEAAAAGLPIISTAVGALAEAAIDGRSALVVPPGEGAALRAAIERLVDDEALRVRLGTDALALARSKFDAARNNQKILELVTSVARPAGARRVA
jgi:glycosyltransferase involved in cell wall biosynthesis